MYWYVHSIRTYIHCDFSFRVTEEQGNMDALKAQNRLLQDKVNEMEQKQSVNYVVQLYLNILHGCRHTIMCYGRR